MGAEPPNSTNRHSNDAVRLPLKEKRILEKNVFSYAFSAEKQKKLIGCDDPENDFLEDKDPFDPSPVASHRSDKENSKSGPRVPSMGKIFDKVMKATNLDEPKFSQRSSLNAIVDSVVSKNSNPALRFSNPSSNSAGKRS